MSTYKTGTVSVSNGEAVVTGSGTAWAVALVKSGVFSSAGLAIPIASVESDTSLTLDYAWPGDDAVGAPYSIARENSDAASVIDLYDRLSRILVTLSLAGIHPNASGTIADRDLISLGTDDEGFLFLHAEIGVAFAFYRWTGTAWHGPFAVATAVSGDGVQSIVAGTGITVDSTNPDIPVVALASMTSATLRGLISDETGTGVAVFAGAPTLTGIPVFSGIPRLTGGALSFPATQVASAGANDLDDYEEGTFTPVVAGTTTAGVGTYAQQDGIYTKIGRVVFFEIALNWTAHTGTGFIVINGLPFTVGATPSLRAASVLFGALSYTGDPTALISAGGTSISPRTMATIAASSQLAMDTAATIVISGFYTV